MTGMRLFSTTFSQAPRRLAQAGGLLAAALVAAGCGNNYRPTVTPVPPNGPPAQVASYAVAVSAPSPSTPGIATIIDYSGDSVMAEAPIGVGPIAFTIDVSATTGYTYNSDHTITNFPVTPSLQQKNELVTTLNGDAVPVNLDASGLGLWIGNLTGNLADIFTGSPQTYKQSVPLSPATTPVFIAGTPTAAAGQREYVINQNIANSTGVECNLTPTAEPNGTAVPIEVSNYNADEPSIPVGKCPVFAVQSFDQRRLFVLNRGDDTITVINSQANALDDCMPSQNQNNQWVTCHPTIQLPAGSGPVYAEYNQAKSQLVVANFDGGTISVIDVPMDQYGNDANTYTNSNCATYADCGAITGGFGTVHTITVGNTATPNPASVTVLNDGSKAYSANQNDTADGKNGTVTVVNLTTYTVEKTLTVVGHPRTVVSTQNSGYNKVYVASPDSYLITVISSSPSVVDTIGATVQTQANVVDVRTTTQAGQTQSFATYAGTLSISNANFSSRVPGFGQPCNQPGVPAPTGSQTQLQACQAIP